MTKEDFLAAEGKTEEEFDAELDKRTREAMKAQFVLDEIVEKEQLSVNEAELTEHLVRPAPRYGMAPGPVRPAGRPGRPGRRCSSARSSAARRSPLVLEGPRSPTRPAAPVDLEALREDAPGRRAARATPTTASTTPATTTTEAVRRSRGPRRTPAAGPSCVRVTAVRRQRTPAAAGSSVSRARVSVGTVTATPVDDRRETGDAPSERADHAPASRPRRGARRSRQGMGLDDQVYNRLLARAHHLPRLRGRRRQSPTRSARSCCCSPPRTPTRTSALHQLARAARSTAGMAIYDTMQFVTNDVATVAMGLAASMGQFLLCAGTTGKRYALPHARIMMHQPSGGLGGTAVRHHDPGRADALHQEDDGRAASPTTPARPSSRSRPTPTATAGSPPRRPRTTASSTTSSPAPARSPAAAAPHDRTTSPRPGSPRGDRAQMSDLYQPSSRYVLPVVRRAHVVRRQASQDPYTKLFEERIIFLGVQIDDASANDVMAQLLTLESMDPDRDISIYINSPGGSFTALTAIYDTMQFVRPDIQTVCLGQAASAAAVLLAAGTPGKRFALPNARILIHQPSTEGGGQASRHRDPGPRDPADARAAGGDARQALRPRRRSRSARTSSATRSSPPRRPWSTA